MTNIKVNLFAYPEIFKNGEKINFPFKKAEALIFYMVLYKQASRDTIVNLLWGDLEEAVAKKNLRNAVYSIKKIFNEEVLISPKRSVLIFNPEINVEVDIEKFLSSNLEESVEVYKGDFLEGFYLKYEESFEGWVLELREYYKDLYIHKLQEIIEKYESSKDIKKLKKYCKALILVDEYNEKAYRTIMYSYKEEGKYDKAIYIYNKLLDLLKKELEVSPDEKTINLYKEIIHIKNSEKVCEECDETSFFYGRSKELNLLKNNYNNFILNKSVKTPIVIGEAGIGKSSLVCKFLSTINTKKINIISAVCYQAEEEYLLKPWNNVFNQISNIIYSQNITISQELIEIISCIFPTFQLNKSNHTNIYKSMDMIKYQAAEEAAIKILNECAKSKKLILFFDDIQWIDKLSITMLKNLILQNRNKNILPILVSREEYNDKTINFLNQLQVKNLISEIQLHRLNKEQTLEFISKYIPNFNLNNEKIEAIYEETEGNIFFITEMLNNIKESKDFNLISPKMENILQTRLYSLNRNERKILNIISVFFDKVNFGNLKMLCNYDDFELIDILGELKNKCIIKENFENENINIQFTHQKMREFVYSKAGLLEKKILHEKIGQLIEESLKHSIADNIFNSKLIYHFERSGNKLKSLKYMIKELNMYLQSHHEIFPVVNEELKNTTLGFLTDAEAFDKFKKFNNILYEIKETTDNAKELKELKITLEYMIGRDYIRSGNYTEGVKIMEGIIDEGSSEVDITHILNAYKQLIYYSMNIYDSVKMDKYLKRALDITIKNNLKEEIPILYRLTGFQKIMQNKYEEAEMILKKSIDRFNELRDRNKYILNIAAAYDFLGEVKKREVKFEEALKNYEKAITMCEENHIKQGLPIFYTHAAYAACELNITDTSKIYIENALNMYEKMDVIWEKASAYGILALILSKSKDNTEALKAFTKAEAYYKLLKNPQEYDILEGIKQRINIFK